MKSRSLFLACFLAAISALGQANGNLQIHYMDVGQGDGALLVSPGGQPVLFDSGVRNQHHRPMSYFQQLGVTQSTTSHYHDDHIGAVVHVLDRFPLQIAALDRGGNYTTATFSNYTNFVGAKRKTAIEGSSVTLDAASAHPVRIEFAALNGNGVSGAKDENDLSLVCVVRFGQFDAVFGGDLSGAKASKYRDIETSVAAMVGQVEVYKVNHHGSRHSSNPAWMAAVAPRLGVISCGENNTHGHPHQQALERLAAANVDIYWTAMGNAAHFVSGRDTIGGNMIVEAAPGSTTFTLAHGNSQTNTYEVWNAVTVQSEFAWSVRSEVYHFENCLYVGNISPANLQTGTSPPAGKRLHLGCPK